MKLFYILLLTLPLLAYSFPAAEEKSISLEEDVDNEHAESEQDSQIQKRSGNSFDYVTQLKSGLLSSIGHASASIASGSSGGSSGGGGGGSYKSIDGHHGNAVDYDPWSFKKSVLNTILQAVKAITGGVTALKGQLIKGSGYALSASGNIVAAGGEKVTDVGKSIINSAQINSHSYGTSHNTGFVHPFAKFSSLSGASSGGSGSKHSSSGPVVHTETITTYEIPTGHSNYGPPSKPPTYSSATHQYLPPAGPPAGGSYSGGAPFTGGHVAFEAPPNNYLPTSYGHDGYDDFNIYPRHKKLTDEEARKAAAQLQEILNLLPKGKTEYTATKTVALDVTSPGQVNPENVNINSYGATNDLGPLESLSHTESITAAYGAPNNNQWQSNPSDIYRQMAKKQTPEEIYLQNHPNEGYDYKPTAPPAETNDYKYDNYHANTKNALQDLTPIIAALEVAKKTGGPNVNTHYTIEKSVERLPGTTSGQFKYFSNPVVQTSKYTYFNPAQHNGDVNYRPVYNSGLKVRRHVGQPTMKIRRNGTILNLRDFEIQNPLEFNRMLNV